MGMAGVALVRVRVYLYGGIRRILESDVSESALRYEICYCGLYSAGA